MAGNRDISQGTEMAIEQLHCSISSVGTEQLDGGANRVGVAQHARQVKFRDL